MKKLVSIMGAAGAVAIAATVAVAAPASATTSGTCQDHNVCVYSNTSYTGDHFFASGYNADTPLGDLVNRVESWKNRSDATSFDLVDDPGFLYAGGVIETLGSNQNHVLATGNRDKADRVRQH